MNKQMVKDWTKQKVALYDATGASGRKSAAAGTAGQVDAKRGVWGIKPLRPGGLRDEYAVVSFVEPGGGKAFIGREADFYLDIGTAITGVKLSGSGIHWHESLITNRKFGAGTNEVAAQFEVQVDGDRWREKIRSESLNAIYLQEALGPGFAAASPLSQQPGEPKLAGVSVSGGILRLELTNQTGELAGTVWIDIKTRKFLRAVLNGKEVFPRRSKQ